jgi:dolichol-phosphate mannosyltransferase
MSQANMDLISIVIPVYNEENNLPILYSRLKATLNSSQYSYEIIFVDDGSIDNSWEYIEKLCVADSLVKGIRFSRNFGHQFALSAGIDYAKGNAVVTMDADLQHPPEMIPRLTEKWKEGFDIVYTIRGENKDASLFKRLSSNFFYTVINKFARISIPMGAADFRLLGRDVVDSFKSFHERTRFLRGLVGWMGYRNIGISYTADERFAGKTKYSFIKMVAFAVTGITSFSSFPLYISAFLGFIIAAISFFYGIYAVYVKIFTDKVVPGWTSVLLSVLFLGGVQLIAIGVLGEYLSRVYEEVKQRPLYLIAQKKGF